VAGFEVDGRVVVDGGVPPLRVVPGFDELEDGGGELASVVPAAPVQQFELEGAEERFGHGVVEGVADGAHRSEQPGLAEALAERPGGVLGEFKW